MPHTDTMMIRRRRVSLTLKLIGVVFIVLVLMRTDWLAALFLHNAHPQHTGKDVSLLLNDRVPLQGRQNGYNNHNGERKSLLRQMMNSRQKPECSIPHLKNFSNADDINPALCRRIKPFKSSCQRAEELFGDPWKLDIANACNLGGDQTYCKIEGSPAKWRAKCYVTSCDQTLLLGTKDMSSGDWKWTAHKSVIELQNHIEYLISNDNLGFCMIDCDEKLGSPDGSSLPQILNLPPHSNAGSSATKKKLININIVFIDSVSRHHFYRSLPRSVSALDTLASSGDTLVLDFEKVQGVRSRTFETLQTLFSGDINPFMIPFGVQEMPSKKLGVLDMFRPFKQLGYSTLWLEDLCPYWEWGLSKDLLVYNKSLDRSDLHRKFMSAMKYGGIDSVGNTFSSCHILHSNGRPDPFHGLDKVCYNGRHQHEYLLDYLKMYAEEKLHKSQPYISFFETNVAHEGSGKRVQYLDVAFKEYLEHISNMHNTLTVIFSDHGNAYGDFVKTGNEGRLEMFHPFLFMIIPKEVQAYFTARQLQSLRGNQHRLISVLDLHYTLFYIIENLDYINRNNNYKSQDVFRSKVSDFNRQFNVSEYGLLAEISPARTCSHIPRVMPNLCMCEGYDSAVLGNLGYHEVLSLYFIGTLNNEILKQRQGKYDPSSRQALAIGGFGRCKRFTVNKIKNIQQSKLHDDEMVAKMDLYVQTPGHKSAEIFFVSVHIKHGSTISLGSFERITPYSQYSICVDKGVELQLCVCDIEAGNRTNKDTEYEEVINYFEDSAEDVLLDSQMYTSSSMKNKVKSITVNGVECVFIITHSNKFGIVYEALNNCNMILKLTITLEPVYLLLSTETTFTVTLLPKDIKFLTAGVEDGKGEWSCEIHVRKDQLSS